MFWFLGKLLEVNIGLKMHKMCRPDTAGLYFIDVTLATQDNCLVLEFFLAFPSLVAYFPVITIKFSLTIKSPECIAEIPDIRSF